LGFQSLRVDGEILEVILVCFGPLFAAGRESLTRATILGVANNQHDSVFRSLFSSRYDYQCGAEESRDKQAAIDQGALHVL
jgi:hypothetical protein